MKIVVMGGTGLIGTKVVKRLVEQGHQASDTAERGWRDEDDTADLRDAKALLEELA